MSEAIETKEIPDGFRQTQLGPRTITVPEHWSRVRVKDVSEVVTRGKQPTYVDDPGVPVLNQSCIYWDGYYPENLKYLDEDVAEDWKSKHFASKGDILINSTGQGTLGRALYWDKESGTHAIDSHITRVSVDSETIDPEFLRYYLESTWGQTMLYVFCVAGSTGQIELSKTDLMSMPLLSPPLEEQRRIADILSTVDEQIQQTTEIVKEMKELKRGVTNELLNKGISHSEYNTVYFGPMGIEIPAEWDVEPLKHVTEDITDGVHSTPDYVKDGIPFLSTKNVNPFRKEFDTSSYEKYISKEDHEDMTSNIKPEKGDLIIARRATIGPTQLVRVDSEFSIFVGLGLIKPTKQIDGSFLEQFFNWNKIQSVLNLKSPGSTMKTLNLSTLRNQVIPIPSLSEQQKIAGILQIIDGKVQNEQETKKHLQELKRGLMQDLLTGTVRVDPEQAN